MSVDAIVVSKYKCPEHGDIGNNVFAFHMEEGAWHIYCSRCVEELLRKHIPQVKEIKNETATHADSPVPVLPSV